MGAAISGLLLHIGTGWGCTRRWRAPARSPRPSWRTRTGTTERYVREWLGIQAAGGYVIYHPAECTYELPAEQAMVLADEDSLVFFAAY